MRDLTYQTMMSGKLPQVLTTTIAEPSYFVPQYLLCVTYNKTVATSRMLASKKSTKAKNVFSVWPAMPTLARTLEMPLSKATWSGRRTWYSCDWSSIFALFRRPERYMDRIADIPTIITPNMAPGLRSMAQTGISKANVGITAAMIR